MYTEVKLQNLRGIREVHIDGLRPINLLVGRNNSGKTTILEGVFLLGGATSPVFPITLGQLRGQRLGRTYPDAVWRPLFYNLDPRQRIGVDGRWERESAPRRLEIEALDVSSFAEVSDSDEPGTGGIASVTEDFVVGGLRLRYRPAVGREITTTAIFDPKTGNIEAPSKDREDFVRTTFLSARTYPSLLRDAEQYSFLLRIKKEGDILEAVQIIEPAIERIEVLSEPGGPTVYVDLGLESLVPLAVCGEGFVRLFSIAVELTASRGGVLLIDEIDNGLHYSVMPKLWTLLGDLCDRHNVQLLATTHNEELIFSALEGFKDQPERLGLFRVDRKDGRHTVAGYGVDAQRAVREVHFEVRG